MVRDLYGFATYPFQGNSFVSPNERRKAPSSDHSGASAVPNFRSSMSKPKSAVDFDQAADRPDRPKPTNRISTPYAVVEAHGVPNLGVTVDQTNCNHELASDNTSIAQGQIIAGEPGSADAERRYASIDRNRKATEAAFDALRPTVAGTRKRLGK